MLGLHCCAWAFSSCGERELLSLLCRLLIAVAFLVAEMSSRAQASVDAVMGSVVSAPRL